MSPIGGTEDPTRLLEAAEEMVATLQAEVERLREELKKYLEWDNDPTSECYDARHVPLEAFLAAHQAVVRELAEALQQSLNIHDECAGCLNTEIHNGCWFPRQDVVKVLAHPLVQQARARAL